MIDKPESSSYLRGRGRRINSTLLVLLAGFCLGWGLAGSADAAAVQEANADRAGQTLDLATLPVKGKITVVDFYSPYCPPCMAIGPLLEQLSQKRPELAIQKVNIQRPEKSGGIDWQSPLAQQMGFGSIGIPYFLIFDKHGKMVAKGKEAQKQVIGWLQEAGLIKSK